MYVSASAHKANINNQTIGWQNNAVTSSVGKMHNVVDNYQLAPRAGIL